MNFVSSSTHASNPAHIFSLIPTVSGRGYREFSMILIEVAPFPFISLKLKWYTSKTLPGR